MGLALATPVAGFGDRFVYWTSAGNPQYDLTEGLNGASFLYSPAAAQALALVGWLPFEVFWWLFAIAAMAATAWLVRPLGWRFGLPAWLMALPVSLHGNVEFLFAVVAVLGLRYPALWAIPLLTKIVPGVGVLWFLVRKEWRNFAVALGTTGAIALGSWALAPLSWSQWLTLVWENARANGAGWSLVPIPLPLRVASAAIIIAWGARSRREWTIVIGMMLARPDLWLSELAMLTALPRMMASRRWRFGDVRRDEGAEQGDRLSRSLTTASPDSPRA